MEGGCEQLDSQQGHQRGQQQQHQQTQVLSLLADKGVTAQGLEDGIMRALLQLKG